MSDGKKATNVTWHESYLSREQREALLGQKGVIVWLTGLSASGKSTIAMELEYQLHRMGRPSAVLDGDNVRHGLNKNLGFSPEDRAENIRRIGEVAKLCANAGLVVVTGFISPYRGDRDQVRANVNEGDFIEVYVDCALEVCEQRDPKGMYAKARAGEVLEFTGVSAPYEPPERPELVIHSDRCKPEEAAAEIIAYLVDKGKVSRP